VQALLTVAVPTPMLSTMWAICWTSEHGTGNRKQNVSVCCRSGGHVDVANYLGINSRVEQKYDRTMVVLQEAAAAGNAKGPFALETGFLSKSKDDRAIWRWRPMLAVLDNLMGTRFQSAQVAWQLVAYLDQA
jgi:hypothetical protein